MSQDCFPPFALQAFDFRCTDLVDLLVEERHNVIAIQHIEGGDCGCTIENEYYAYVTGFYVLQETGRMDLLESKWRGAYNDSGQFDSGKLWKAVKEAYPECPEY